MNSSKTVKDQYQALLDGAKRRLANRREGISVEIQIGSATCEHAAGSQTVFRELQNHLESTGRDDISLHRTGCTGRCSREPIVSVTTAGRRPVKYQRVDRQAVHQIFTSHVMHDQPVDDYLLDETAAEAAATELLFCDGIRCGRDLGFDPRTVLREELEKAGRGKTEFDIVEANCFGLCSRESRGSGAHVLVRPSGLLYRINSKEDVQRIVREDLLGGRKITDLEVKDTSLSKRFFEMYGELAFFNQQTRIALRNAGVIDPESLDEYLEYSGFEALARVLEKNDPQWLLEQLETAKLRGRGGGGFPTAKKWSFARSAQADEKYIICNADEGDPGAFMDRSMLESDPFSVIEGMIIGGVTIGASRGFVYVRAEYPLAIKRLEHALSVCSEYGLLGDNLLGSGFSFEIEIRLGAGAFVCGEETALIHSIEGARGQPRIRPPYPTASGLWGKPTVINNVETFANIPVVVSYGGEWFGRLGSENSGGTKVFALAGKVEHTGLVEVPMGSTLRQVVFGIGGGVPDGKEVKAIQTGGPAGGCIPAEWLDTKVDFDSLAAKGSIMGSGGMIVLDTDSCMVDVAKFFMTFSQDESCGKCTPCREGTTRVVEILERITQGQGEPQDLSKLERLCILMKRSSLCGLGRAASNPVLSTLREFRAEYEAHVESGKCPAHVCKALVRYEINPEKCVGCTLCARNCPVECISGERKQVHVIDQARCIKCGRCFEVCRFDAVDKL